MHIPYSPRAMRAKELRHWRTLAQPVRAHHYGEFSLEWYLAVLCFVIVCAV